MSPCEYVAFLTATFGIDGGELHDLEDQGEEPNFDDAGKLLSLRGAAICPNQASTDQSKIAGD
jgi:hypothetical protein